MSLDELRELCARYWNPIGVPMANVTSQEELGFPPLPVDEYDTYLQYMEYMVQKNADVQEIRGYLETVERDYLMLSLPSGNKDTFIQAVLEAYRGRG